MVKREIANFLADHIESNQEQWFYWSIIRCAAGTMTETTARWPLTFVPNFFFHFFFFFF